MGDWLDQMAADFAATARVRMTAKLEAARHAGYEEAAAQSRQNLAELTRLLAESELQNRALRDQINRLMRPNDVNGEQ